MLAHRIPRSRSLHARRQMLLASTGHDSEVHAICCGEAGDEVIVNACAWFICDWARPHQGTSTLAQPEDTNIIACILQCSYSSPHPSICFAQSQRDPAINRSHHIYPQTPPPIGPLLANPQSQRPDCTHTHTHTYNILPQSQFPPQCHSYAPSFALTKQPCAAPCPPEPASPPFGAHASTPLQQRATPTKTTNPKTRSSPRAPNTPNPDPTLKRLRRTRPLILVRRARRVRRATVEVGRNLV
jgi:hypothetical protein